MFQLKISAAFLVAVLVVVGASYYLVDGEVTEGVLLSEAQDIRGASRIASMSQHRAEHALRALAAELTSKDALVEAMAENQREIRAQMPTPTALREMGDVERTRKVEQAIRSTAQRSQVQKQLIQWQDRQQEQMRRFESSEPLGREALFSQVLASKPDEWFGVKPKLVLAFQVIDPLVTLVADTSGGSPGGSYGGYAPLKQAIETRETVIDVFQYNSLEYIAAFTPVITEDGELLGVVAICYLLQESALPERLSSGLASDQHVVVVVPGERDRFFLAPREADAQAKAMSAATYRSLEFARQGEEVDVRVADTTQSFDQLAPGQLYLTELAGRRYMVERVDWLESADAPPQASLYVLSNYETSLGPLSELKATIPLIGVIVLTLGLVLIFLLIRSFLRPIEQIDLGIQEILAGNREHVFTARKGHALHTELANALNALVANLQGKETMGEEEGWDQMLVDLEPERQSLYGLQAVQIVSDDDEKKRLRALYDNYMAKRNQHGQGTDMDFDRFVRRIKRNEETLKEKHGCEKVTFHVAVSKGKVVLKPKFR